MSVFNKFGANVVSALLVGAVMLGAAVPIIPVV